MLDSVSETYAMPKKFIQNEVLRYEEAFSMKEE